MTIRINIIAIVAIGLLFSGCAIKKTDNAAQKTAKHLVNSPVYVGMAATKAVEFAILAPFALVGVAKDKLKGTNDSSATEK